MSLRQKLLVVFIIAKILIFSLGARAHECIERSSQLLDDGISSAEQLKLQKCKSVLDRTQGGKNFVLHRIVSDNFLLLASLYLANPQWLTNLEKRDFLTYQLVATNLHSLITSGVGKKLALSAWSFRAELVGRWVTVVASSKGQSVIGSFMLNPSEELGSSESRARAIEFANYIWSVPSILKSLYVDRILIKKAPMWSYNFCLKNSSLSYLMLPGTLNFLDRSGTWLLYLGYLRVLTGE